MARRSILSEEETAEINLSPMIDCIFILLIFFIVTTVFVEEQGFQVNKPDAAASATLEDQESLIFEITEEDEIRFEDREIGLDAVADLVKARVEGPETPVTIRAHEKSDHGTFVALWDVARRNGAETLGFSTTN